MQACLEHLAAMGIPKCTIFLFADNAEGKRFWERNGWIDRADLRMLQKPLTPTPAKAKCACGGRGKKPADEASGLECGRSC